VTADELERTEAITPIASVQNPYSLAVRGSEELIDRTAASGIAFVPYTPLVGGALAQPGGPLDAIGAERGATAAQVALAWLLARSDNILLIPGTASIAHLEENVGAAAVELGEADIARIEEIARGEAAAPAV
jgi:aryl-alcohol dehydrogenase-like predicted oxidoreductase